MPYIGPLFLTINGAAAGAFALPCDGGRTTVPAIVDMKLGWTAAEVAATATATLELRLTDNDIFPFNTPDPYAVRSFAASAADLAVAAPGFPFSATPVKWTRYTLQSEIFCAKYGCVLCARDQAGVIGSQGVSKETFKGYFVLTTATDSEEGRTAGEVVIKCDPNVTAVTPIGRSAATTGPATFPASLQPASGGVEDWVYVVDTVVERRLRDALTQRIPRLVGVVDDQLVEPIGDITDPASELDQ
jgi:hypothetical protein